jgi:hypothetical protein
MNMDCSRANWDINPEEFQIIHKQTNNLKYYAGQPPMVGTDTA